MKIGSLIILKEFSLLVDYSQVLVYRQSLIRPELLWNDSHVAQGFAWSEGVVSFGVPDHDGLCLVHILMTKNNQIEPDCLWSIQVPFEVNEPIKIGGLFDAFEIDISPGNYNLIFEASEGKESHAYFLKIKFFKTPLPEFNILKQGNVLGTDTVISKSADFVSRNNTK